MLGRLGDDNGADYRHQVSLACHSQLIRRSLWECGTLTAFSALPNTVAFRAVRTLLGKSNGAQSRARAAKREVRVAARAVPVHQSSSRWRLMPTAIATCSKRTFGSVR